jgi:hypothetical protein
MKKGSQVTVRAPHSDKTRRAKVVQRHETHNGDWLELAPVDDNGKAVKNTPTFRARPAMCSPA